MLWAGAQDGFDVVDRSWVSYLDYPLICYGSNPIVLVSMYLTLQYH